MDGSARECSVGGLLVSLGTPLRADRFCAELDFPPSSLFVDPEAASHAALGLRKGVVETFASPATPLGFLRRVRFDAGLGGWSGVPAKGAPVASSKASALASPAASSDAAARASSDAEEQLARARAALPRAREGTTSGGGVGGGTSAADPVAVDQGGSVLEAVLPKWVEAQKRDGVWRPPRDDQAFNQGGLFVLVSDDGGNEWRTAFAHADPATGAHADLSAVVALCGRLARGEE